MTRVLVVDDKEENTYYLNALLSAHGCVVESARDGAEALRKARHAPPSLVISDLLMPVMDGYTLLRCWKADELLNPPTPRPSSPAYARFREAASRRRPRAPNSPWRMSLACSGSTARP
jgi:CheY-like chemotaxis protein